MPEKFGPPADKSFQTTFGFGKDHFSQSHKNHDFGSTAPVQRDFGLNMPDEKFKPLVGMDSPIKEFQTKLINFKH